MLFFAIFEPHVCRWSLALIHLLCLSFAISVLRRHRPSTTIPSPHALRPASHYATIGRKLHSLLFTMGIEKLPAMLKACAPKRKIAPVVSTLSPAHTVVGIDMSCAIMASLRTLRGSVEHHQDPPVPAHHVAASCLLLLRRLMQQNIVPVAVFDGMTRHPMKEAVAHKKKRDKPTEKARADLKDALETPWPFLEKQQAKLLDRIEKARKRSSVVNSRVLAEVIKVLQENSIVYIVSLSEADWMLAYMYNLGIIHAIVTSDSDIRPSLMIHVYS